MRGLRADAERNRTQLVRVAREVFAERGLDAPLDEIARRAEVGNATLYRRFPTRGDLIAAVFVETLGEVVAATDRAIAEPDPWTAFTNHLIFLCELQAGNRALADLLVSTASHDPEVEELRARAYEGLTTLIERAKAAGRLRADFSHEDVVIILMANAGLLERTAADAPTAWRRHLGYLLDGLQVPARTPLPPSPGSYRVLKAMITVARRHGCD
ncbi:TetR/AcrR family transcriptional regulator [Acrocarpospora catenulata]|uniref:TetR/AcrR family transcriptional regulator n=1 Tax=Acrocarpospora catenulata TaxID=2836182 RepID=UPI001BDA9523|nr:TetR/AcrR family transcriptional regulator [Acrocarpospora catenulata]